MAKEYIEKEAVLKKQRTLTEYDEGGWDAKVAVVEVNDIKDIPAADVVEVVRCKDCIHWLNEEGLDDHVCLKIYSDGAVSQFAWQHREPNDFCSYGERRTDDGNKEIL